jgi:hypothetical protein
MEPRKLVIRAYQVGFGDCFLLSFGYSKSEKRGQRERHVLIDFGSTGMPEGIKPSEQMLMVANDIAERCDGKLDIVVATHRHKDHISGFTTNDDETASGNIIARLKPHMVIQPWTEDPALKDPKLPPLKRRGAQGMQASAPAQFLSSLHAMNLLAESAHREVQHLTSAKFRQPLAAEVAEQIDFLANDNTLPNRSAVANLASMGENHYVHFGYPVKLSQLLPGVKVHVLGPPTLEQHAEIQRQRSRDANEFWMLRAAAQRFWGIQSATAAQDQEQSQTVLFPGADVYQDFFPSHDRWFIRQLRTLRAEQLLGLVRVLDDEMNNTSVILLFEVGGKKLLFPGDAQIENWEYALGQPEVAKLLSDVSLYKVGHHGSRNATPKTLWNMFSHKNPEMKARNRLRTVISTMKGKHGHRQSQTEVPRTTLVKELSNLSDYITTETAAKNAELYVETELRFS